MLKLNHAQGPVQHLSNLIKIICLLYLLLFFFDFSILRYIKNLRHHLQGHVRVHIWNWPINDESTKSLCIKILIRLTYIITWMNHYFFYCKYFRSIIITHLHSCVCPKPGFGFPMSYVMVVFVFSELSWEVIVRFVDIGGIDDHHWLNFVFDNFW